MAKGFIVKQEEGFAPIPIKQALKGRVAQFEMQFQEEQKHRKEAEEGLVSALQLTSVSPNASGDSTSEISILKGFNTIANKFAELLENSHDVLLVAKECRSKRIFHPDPLRVNHRSGHKAHSNYYSQIDKNREERVRDCGGDRIEIRKSDNVIFDIMVADADDVLLGVPDPLSEEINHAIGIWVHNPSFARSTRMSIEEMWKLAEKV